VKSMLLGRRAVLALALSFAGLGAAQAQTVEEFYKDKTVTLIISAAPGGASDFFGRQFAQYLGEHIPGKPQVIVTNVPGASGMTAALQLQDNQPRDGTVIAILQRNNFYLPLISEDNAAFDPKSVNWLGSLNKEFYTIIAWDDAPVEKPEDVFTTPITIGATSFANENRTFPAMMNDYFGAKFEIIPGYEGNEAVGLAMERGEVQGRAQTINSLLAGSEAAWIKEGKIKVLMQLAPEASPAFPDVPLITSFSKDPEVLALAAFMLEPLNAGRPFAAPPDVPQDRIDALRAAFDAAAADPAFLETMKKANSDVDPISGAAVEAIIDDLYATPEPVLEKVRALLTPQ
jgi:tripartite-type tricarboxylate transporter receptor subunit TctC